MTTNYGVAGSIPATASNGLGEVSLDFRVCPPDKTMRQWLGAIRKVKRIYSRCARLAAEQNPARLSMMRTTLGRLMRCSVMATHWTLTPNLQVRILSPQPKEK